MIASHMNTCHVDKGALHWLATGIEGFEPKTFLDVGCSTMGMVGLALSEGLDAYGLDGDHGLLGKIDHSDRFICVDMTKKIHKSKQKFDIIWSVETAEHIPVEFVDRYMQTILYNISTDGVVVMTHALPGSESATHRNCQLGDYWIDMFANYNMWYNGLLTIELRKHSTMKREFMQKTGKLFRVGEQ